MRSYWNSNRNTRGKRNETAREESLRKSTVKVLAAFADLSKLLKKLENMVPNTKRFLLRERIFMVHYLLTSQSMMKTTNQANHHGCVFQECRLPKKSPRQVLQEVF